MADARRYFCHAGDFAEQRLIATIDALKAERDEAKERCVEAWEARDQYMESNVRMKVELALKDKVVEAARTDRKARAGWSTENFVKTGEAVDQALNDLDKVTAERDALLIEEEKDAIEIRHFHNLWEEAAAEVSALSARVRELTDLVRDFAEGEVEYMRINNLGDGEKQHNVKRARALIGKGPSK